MHLVQVLLPLRDDKGGRFPAQDYEEPAREFTVKFGGVTSFSRSPAEGRWKDGGATAKNDVIVLEVMAEELDRPLVGNASETAGEEVPAGRSRHPVAGDRAVMIVCGSDNFALPERWVTVHSGDMGYTMGLLRGAQNALESV